MAASENGLRARLAKLDELFRRGATEGERAAAGAAMGRLRDRIGSAGADPEIELKLSLLDVWSVHLFVAVCRKHGVRPYRYPRQRRTTIMVRVSRSFFDQIVWAEFSGLQAELLLYF